MMTINHMFRQTGRMCEALKAEDAVVGEVVHAVVHHHEVRGEHQGVARSKAARIPRTLATEREETDEIIQGDPRLQKQVNFN